jgi:hypothetical protein
MTQAFNLALHANFINASGQVSASGIQAGAIPAAFPSGTVMLFVQTSAPTGWVKSTAHNNKSLRVVSGTAGSGGSVAFTTAFGTPSVSGSVSLSGSVEATTLTIAQIPSHTHPRGTYDETIDGPFRPTIIYEQSNTPETSTGATGGGGSHTHGFSGSGTLSGASTAINVQYVDVIICTKS